MTTSAGGPAKGSSAPSIGILATLGAAIAAAFRFLAELFGHAPGPAGTAAAGNGAVAPDGAAAGLVPLKPAPATPVRQVPPGVPDVKGPYGFGPHSFLPAPTGSGPTPGGANGTWNYNPLQFATLEAAQTVARLLGGRVIDLAEDYNATPFKMAQPYYHVQVGRTVLNAGLVVATFLRNPHDVAMAMIRAEIR